MARPFHRSMTTLLIAAALVFLVPPANAEGENEGDGYCTTTDFGLDDPMTPTGAYQGASGEPVPDWIYIWVVVNEGGVYFSVRMIIEVDDCAPLP